MALGCRNIMHKERLMDITENKKVRRSKPQEHFLERALIHIALLPWLGSYLSISQLKCIFDGNEGYKSL